MNYQVMTDAEIKLMLEKMHRDLNRRAEKIEWIHREFIPLEERKKTVMMNKLAMWLIDSILALAFFFYFVPTYAQEYQQMAIGLGVLFFGSNIYVYYRYALPKLLNKEYNFWEYRLTASHLESRQPGLLLKRERLSRDKVLWVDALPLPQSDKKHYQTIRDQIQQTIQQRYGIQFRA